MLFWYRHPGYAQNYYYPPAYGPHGYQPTPYQGYYNNEYNSNAQLYHQYYHPYYAQQAQQPQVHHAPKHPQQVPKPKPRKQKLDSVLDTPEEIQKWIASRKRNYPTKQNIERKQKAIQARVEKGIPVTAQQLQESGDVSLLEQKLAKKVVMMSEFESKKTRKHRKRKHKGQEEGAEKFQRVEEAEDGEVVQEVQQVRFDLPEQVVEEPEKVAVEVTKGKWVVSLILVEHPQKHQRDNKHQQQKNQNKNDKPQFRYKKNTIYDDLLKKEKDSELSVILQCFRYIVKQKLIP